MDQAESTSCIRDHLSKGTYDSRLVKWESAQLGKLAEKNLLAHFVYRQTDVHTLLPCVELERSPILLKEEEEKKKKERKKSRFAKEKNSLTTRLAIFDKIA